MAYENIQWQLPAQQEAQRQAQFADMVGKGMQAAQFQQEMDLKRRQLDSPESFDLGKKAELELYKKEQGLPYDENAIRAFSQLKGSQMHIDPVTGRVITQPDLATRAQLTPMQQMGGSTNIPNLPQGVTPYMPQGQTIDFGGQQFPVMSEGQLNAPYDGDPANPIPSMPSTYKAGGILAGTPKGMAMEEESKQKLSESIAAEKAKRGIQGLERFADAQLQAANFGNRMVESDKIMRSLKEKSPDAEKGMTGKLGITKQVLDILPLGDFGSSLGAAAVHAGANEEQQQYMNAAENWITANLRKESGAVIGADEMAKEYKKYFPMPADSGALIEQKEKLRKQAEKGMIGQSAGAYQDVFGKKAQAILDQENSGIRSTSWQEYFK